MVFAPVRLGKLFPLGACLCVLSLLKAPILLAELKMTYWILLLPSQRLDRTNALL